MTSDDKVSSDACRVLLAGMAVQKVEHGAVVPDRGIDRGRRIGISRAQIAGDAAEPRRRRIVPVGDADLQPLDSRGRHVDPDDFRAAIEQSIGQKRDAAAGIDHSVGRPTGGDHAVDPGERWRRVGLIPAGLRELLRGPDLVPMGAGVGNDWLQTHSVDRSRW